LDLAIDGEDLPPAVADEDATGHGVVIEEAEPVFDQPPHRLQQLADGQLPGAPLRADPLRSGVHLQHGVIAIEKRGDSAHRLALPHLGKLRANSRAINRLDAACTNAGAHNELLLPHSQAKRSAGNNVSSRARSAMPTRRPRANKALETTAATPKRTPNHRRRGGQRSSRALIR